MIDNLPAAPDPASDTPQQFNAKAAAFVLAQKAMVAQINSTTANLNSIAAGGAYTIPFLGAPTGSIGAAAGGKFALGGITGSEATATSLYVDVTSASGVAVANALDSITSSGSTVKAAVRIVKQSDPTQFLTFNITGVSVFTYYRIYSVQCIANGPNPSPFGDNDLALFHFTRTGDAGTPGILQQVVVRDQRGANVASQSLTANTWNRRVLNTLVGNQVTGFQLGAAAANTFTLTAGKYWIDATAPARSPGNHQIRLFNVTANATYDIGGSDFANSNNTTYPANSRAMLRTYLEITSTVVYAIEHFVTVSFDGGVPSNAGIGEIYTELRIVRVG